MAMLLRLISPGFPCTAEVAVPKRRPEMSIVQRTVKSSVVVPDKAKTAQRTDAVAFCHRWGRWPSRHSCLDAGLSMTRDILPASAHSGVREVRDRNAHANR
jgi:hypothetical protein